MRHEARESSRAFKKMYIFHNFAAFYICFYRENIVDKRMLSM